VDHNLLSIRIIIKIASNLMNFKDYLDSRRETPCAFAKRANLSQVPIYKLYKGGSIRKDTAKRIYRVTKKDVSLESLGYKEENNKVVPLETPICD